MALGRIDAHVLKPAASPDEVFHQAVSSFLLDWTRDRGTAAHTVRVVAGAWTGRAYELREVLQRCAIPHIFHLAESSEGRELLARAGREATLPLVFMPNGRVLSDPHGSAVIEAAGAPVDPEADTFDVTIVGAGPAGLSAAVYAASEGLRTLVVDQGAVGGQATSSSLIRNYLGFPGGVSGARLAERAYEQAWVFGAQFAFMQPAIDLRRIGDRLSLTLASERRVDSGAVIVATGAAYRRLELPELEALNGAGVFYGGPVSEAHSMAGRAAYVVGGANSAGQAALHLARYARRVTLVVRAGSLGAGMSRYLVREIEAAPNVDVRLGTAVVGGGGDGHLERLVLREDGTDGLDTVVADGLFVLIGASPHTSWLPGDVTRDGGGFLMTGPDLADDRGWPLERAPFALETAMPGVFAAGDVRHGSVKRVASAVGEGSVAIQLVHRLSASSGGPAGPGRRGGHVRASISGTS